MTLSWLQGLIFGLVSGLTDILPVSAQAHKAILLKIFGAGDEPPLLRLMLHAAILASLYYCCRMQLHRMVRQLRLSRIPKKRRKRPLDIRTIYDYRLLLAVAVPLLLAYCFYPRTSAMNESLNWIALFLVLNAIIGYIPSLLPSGNKDCRSLSRLEGVLMGLSGGLSILPGISCVGVINTVGSTRGADRGYILNLTLLADMAVTTLLIVFDLTKLVSAGVGTLSFSIFLGYLLSAAAAFAGVFLGVKIMRGLAAHVGFSAFSYYSLGLALLSFIVYLSAA